MYAICIQYATYNIQCTTYDKNKFTTKWAHIAFMGSYDSTNTSYFRQKKNPQYHTDYASGHNVIELHLNNKLKLFKFFIPKKLKYLLPNNFIKKEIVLKIIKYLQVNSNISII